MFTKSAELYDAIYRFKNYAAEAAQVAALVRAVHPGARTLLDVACGTGQHAWHLATEHGFAVDGLDLDEALLEVARRKHPAGRFFVGDMRDFAVAERYDAVLCLFSSIGYLVTLDRVRRALGCFRDHLAPGGIVVVEPWFAPGDLDAGRVMRQMGETAGLRVERVSRTEIDGRISRLHFEYQIEGPEGITHATEVHELGLFTPDEMLASFRAAGLRADFDPVGLDGRGLWIARLV
jgi:ubiquinone/menaquinone biosynthesis C-methylase UbiE